MSKTVNCTKKVAKKVFSSLTILGQYSKVKFEYISENDIGKNAVVKNAILNIYGT